LTRIAFSFLPIKPRSAQHPTVKDRNEWTDSIAGSETADSFVIPRGVRAEFSSDKFKIVRQVERLSKAGHDCKLVRDLMWNGTDILFHVAVTCRLLHLNVRRDSSVSLFESSLRDLRNSSDISSLDHLAHVVPWRIEGDHFNGNLGSRRSPMSLRSAELSTLNIRVSPLRSNSFYYHSMIVEACWIVQKSKKDRLIGKREHENIGTCNEINIRYRSNYITACPFFHHTHKVSLSLFSFFQLHRFDDNAHFAILIRGYGRSHPTSKPRGLSTMMVEPFCRRRVSETFN